MGMKLFKIGDSVKLLSGGPKMTVMGCKKVSGWYMISCAWFIDETGLYGQRLFKDKVLKKVK